MDTARASVGRRRFGPPHRAGHSVGHVHIKRIEGAARPGPASASSSHGPPCGEWSRPGVAGRRTRPRLHRLKMRAPLWHAQGAPASPARRARARCAAGRNACGRRLRRATDEVAATAGKSAFAPPSQTARRRRRDEIGTRATSLNRSLRREALRCFAAVSTSGAQAGEHAEARPERGDPPAASTAVGRTANGWCERLMRGRGTRIVPRPPVVRPAPVSVRLRWTPTTSRRSPPPSACCWRSSSSSAPRLQLPPTTPSRARRGTPRRSPRSSGGCGSCTAWPPRRPRTPSPAPSACAARWTPPRWSARWPRWCAATTRSAPPSARRTASRRRPSTRTFPSRWKGRTRGRRRTRRPGRRGSWAGCWNAASTWSAAPSSARSWCAWATATTCWPRPRTTWRPTAAPRG
jgi:hypothetical protein